MTEKETLVESEVNYNDDYNETDDATTESGINSENNTNNGSEWKTTDDETSKNTSNFKKLSKAYRKAVAEAKKYKNMVDAMLKNTSFDKLANDTSELEMRLYFIENPEARKYKEEMQKILNNYPNMSKEDALILAKAKTPKESDDEQDFSLASQVIKGRKKLEDLNEDEALQLDMPLYKKWAEKNNKLTSVWD